MAPKKIKRMTKRQRALATQWVRLAYGMANKMHARLRHGTANIDDVISWAMWGLCVAAQRYDPKRGVPFGPYAAMIIHQRVSQAITSATCMTRGGQDIIHSFARPLEDGDESMGDSTHYQWEPRDHRLPSPDETAHIHEVRQAMRQCLRPREIKVVEGYYLEQRTMEALGKDLRISKQRVDQIIRTAVSKVQAYITVRMWKSRAAVCQR